MAVCVSYRNAKFIQSTFYCLVMETNQRWYFADCKCIRHNIPKMYQAVVDVFHNVDAHVVHKTALLQIVDLMFGWQFNVLYINILHQ